MSYLWSNPIVTASDGTGTGICEVCHPVKAHKDGKDYTGRDYTGCHSHKDGFGA